MTTTKRIRLVYGIVLSLALILAGICLMAACVNIYLSGDRAFSREAVAEQFSGISWAVYLALALTVGSLILELLLPAEESKRKVDKNHGMILQNLWKKRDLDAAPLPLRESILQQQKRRKTSAIISACLLIVGSGVFLFFGATPAAFHSTDITGSVIRSVVILFACLAIPFGFAVFASYDKRRSLQIEIELVKQIAPGEAAVNTTTAFDYTLIFRLGLLVLALVLVCFGYFNEGTKDVLTKATNICTECVGLG